MGGFLSVSQKLHQHMMSSILFLKFRGGGEKNGKNAVFIFVNTELDIIVPTG